LLKRMCQAIKDTGEPCQQAPLRERDHCLWHDPENAAAAKEARSLGGQRRRREGSLSGAFEFEGLGSPEDLRRILEIAAFDALALDNSVARTRVLIALVQAGVRLFEVSDLDARLKAVEALMKPRELKVRGLP